mmetsp:Transcript_28112/g.89888  ORF Transcript_28112/g.89888 Transcript_28112/m.89888 type:complete len:1079 (+) Transcript_28112:175-3411(+)
MQHTHAHQTHPRSRPTRQYNTTGHRHAIGAPKVSHHAYYLSSSRSLSFSLSLFVFFSFLYNLTISALLGVPEVGVADLVVADERLPARVRLLDKVHGLLGSEGLLPGERVLRLAVARLVALEPLAYPRDGARLVPVEVVDVAHARRERVARADADDLAVRLALVDEREGAENLAGHDAAHGQRAFADLHHVQRVVVAAGAVHDDAGVLPGLGQHAVVEEGRAVRVESHRAVLVQVLLDGVRREALLHLHLGRAVHGDLRHEVHHVAHVLARVELQVVPGARRLGALLHVEREVLRAVLRVRQRVAVGVRVRHRQRVGDPGLRVDVLVVVADDVPSRRHHEPRRDALAGVHHGLVEVALAPARAVARESAHGAARDGDEVLRPLRVRQAHALRRAVVLDLLEGEQPEAADARRRLQHVAPVVAVVEVVVGAELGELRALHARGVAAHHEVRGAGVAPALGVELHLRRPGVDHRRRPDGHDRPALRELRGREVLVVLVLHDGHVLLHAHVQRHVVLLRPAAERREPEHGVLVALGEQLLAAVAHEVGVAGVRRVARLEGVDDVGAHARELLHELLLSEAVLVQAVVVADAAQELHLAAEQPVAAVVDVLDIGVAAVDDAEAARHDLLLAVRVDLHVAQDGHGLAVLRHERDVLLAARLDQVLRVVRRRQHNGHGHAHAVARRHLGKVRKVRFLLVEVGVAGGVRRVNEDGVEVQRLQQRALAHEALERRRPALADGLQPVQVDVREQRLRQRLRLEAPRRQLVLRHVQVHDLAAIRRRQALDGGLRALEHALALQQPQHHVDALLDGHLVVLQVKLGVERRLVRRVHAGEALDLALVHLGVEALRVALLHHVQRHVHEHLHELEAHVLVAAAHGVAVGAEWRHEAHERDHAGVVEQRRQLAHAAHAFGAVRVAEAEVAVQARADVVAVEAVDALAVLEHELLLERSRDGALARAAQARHPKRDALLPQRRVAQRPRQVALLLRPALPGGGALDDVRRRRRELLIAVGADVEVLHGVAVADARLGARQHVEDGQQRGDADAVGHAPPGHLLGFGSGFRLTQAWKLRLRLRMFAVGFGLRLT